MFFVPGLGFNDKESSFSVNGNDFPLLYKKEFNLDDWEDKLVQYHIDFLQYFSNIIDFITPRDYFDPVTGDEAIAGLW